MDTKANAASIRYKTALIAQAVKAAFICKLEECAWKKVRGQVNNSFQEANMREHMANY